MTRLFIIAKLSLLIKGSWFPSAFLASRFANLFCKLVL